MGIPQEKTVSFDCGCGAVGGVVASDTIDQWLAGWLVVSSVLRTFFCQLYELQ